MKKREIVLIAFLSLMTLAVVILIVYSADRFLGGKQDYRTPGASASGSTDPTLDISAPKDKSTTEMKTILVRGQTDPGCQIIINGAYKQPEKDGDFSFPIGLTNGMNGLSICAINKAGKRTVKHLSITYVESAKQPESATNATNTPSAPPPCPSCGGTGKKPCPTCNGGRTVECTNCSGTGNVIVSNQGVTEEVACPSCGGNGWVNCPTCGGTGLIKCSVCGGTGKKK